jgi:Uma2 family endonuclease
VADALPDYRLELIYGEIVMSPKPSNRHQKQVGQLITLFAFYAPQIKALGCHIGGSSYFYEISEELSEKFATPSGGKPSDVCPDASICYRDYLDTDRIPPALLVVEVLSDSDYRHVDRDMATKPEIYAALEIPAYWVVDYRDESIWVHVNPSEGEYALRQQLKGDAILPAPGLEFLQITPAQIFED